MAEAGDRVDRTGHIGSRIIDMWVLRAAEFPPPNSSLRQIITSSPAFALQ